VVRSCSAPPSWTYDFPSRHDVGDVATVSTSDPSAFLNVVLDKPSEDQWTAITLSAGAARQLRDALCAIYPLEGSAAMRINAIDRSQCPVSEVRDTLRHSLTRTSETKGTSKHMILVPLFDLKFLNELAASAVGTSNRRH